MNETTRKILTDERLVSYHTEWFDKMRNLFDGDDNTPIVLNGIMGLSKNPLLICEDPEKWMEECLEDAANRAYSVLEKEWFSPICVGSLLYDVHFVDKIFGAEIFYRDGLWHNWYLDSEVGELEKPDLDKSEAFNLAKRVARAYLDSGVTVPLFGIPVIASALNIAVNLYGEKILLAMLVEPEAAMHDLQIINDVLIEIHQWYLENIPEERRQMTVTASRTQPPGYGQICGCTSQLVSAELYEKFIYPLDDAVLGVYPNGGMIHLCGSHLQLLPLFAKMKNLKCLQLNDRAAEDLEAYADGIREDQVIYLNPCEGMPVEKALEIMKRKNRKMVVVGPYHL